MFWERLIPKKYLVKSSVCGLEILLAEEGPKFFYTLIKEQNNKINITESGSSEFKLLLPEKIKKNKIPIVLCVSGKGLVLKKINLSGEEELDLSEIISQNLPASNANDFHVQLFKQHNNEAFLCFIRKDVINPIIAGIKEAKYEIADILLGPAFISSVQPVVLAYNSIASSFYDITFSNNSVESISLKQDHSENAEVKVGDLYFKASDTLGFASGFIYLTNQKVYKSDDSDLLSYRKNHSERIKLKILTYFFIGISLFICIVNLFCFSHYFKQNNTLETKLSLYQGKYAQINELLSAYEKKKSLIEQAGIMENVTFSKFEDKIASTIPKEVVLTEWVINPVKKRMEEDSLMVFEKNNILIRGNCNKSLIINEWINVLKSQDFISNVNLEKFNFNNEGYMPNFEIKIIIE